MQKRSVVSAIERPAALRLSPHCDCRPIVGRHCEFVIRRCRTSSPRGPTNLRRKEVAVKKSAVAPIVLFAALVASSAANAASYDYTAHNTYVANA
jgi:hypothetical protein